MRRQDFTYELPPELIAHFPAANRRDSRLLCLDGPSGDIEDSQFATLLERLEPGDLLVLNDTRVIPARLFGKKQSGGQVEVLVERMLGKSEVMAHVRASKSPKPGTYIVLEDGSQLEVLAREGALFHLRLEGEGSVLDTLNTLGHMPLPPYIEREDELDDRERYQTVYGKHPGAVAAPTAGLHFDQEFLQALTDRGVKLAYVTLHVGAGTFQPVRVDDIKEHAMHSEWAVVSPEVCELVQATKAAGRRVVAVGTTSVRSLESAAAAGEIQAFSSDTNIFIYPGYQFKVVDALVTNFHLPESTLMMLVSAFAGYRHVMAAYEHAVAQRYRFFSYGDAMFISYNPSAAEQMPGGEA